MKKAFEACFFFFLLLVSTVNGLSVEEQEESAARMRVEMEQQRPSTYTAVGAAPAEVAQSQILEPKIDHREESGAVPEVVHSQVSQPSFGVNTNVDHEPEIDNPEKDRASLKPSIDGESEAQPQYCEELAGRRRRRRRLRLADVRTPTKGRQLVWKWLQRLGGGSGGTTLLGGSHLPQAYVPQYDRDGLPKHATNINGMWNSYTAEQQQQWFGGQRANLLTDPRMQDILDDLRTFKNRRTSCGRLASCFCRPRESLKTSMDARLEGPPPAIRPSVARAREQAALARKWGSGTAIALGVGATAYVGTSLGLKSWNPENWFGKGAGTNSSLP